jgi:sRNA-binding protein
VSRARARAREERVAARRAEVAAAAAERARATRRAERRSRLRLRPPTPPPAVTRSLLVVAGVELGAALLDVSLRVRVGLAIVTLAVLFVYVVSARRSPTR